MATAPTETLLDLAPEDARTVLEAWCKTAGLPGYRARQLYPRLWNRPVGTWLEATELPRDLRVRLDDTFPFPRLHPELVQVSKDGTRKYLWRLPDGEAIESVLIPSGRRRTLCISSQAGCALGCTFCATGRMGFRRNLQAWEITAQVREIILSDPADKPTNVVFMGMGEPLLNWEAVDLALTQLNHPDGFGIGARHITVSTVGIVPAMEKLADRPEQFRLAISLHAPTSPGRRELMPIDRKYDIETVLAVARRFKRRVTFEYVLISEINDRDEDLVELTARAQEVGAMVNLLPLHPGGTPDLLPSPPGRIRSFAAGLRSRGVEAVVRRSRGLDIDAACGQLFVKMQAKRKVARTSV